MSEKSRRVVSALAALEEQYRHLAQVEVDEVARLVRHVRAEVAADDAVPCGVVFLVELFLDVGGDVLETYVSIFPCVFQIFIIFISQRISSIITVQPR